MKDNDYKYSVDVIIPVYNGEKFIAEAINSAISQTYLPEQVIVVNDGSTDNTEKVVLSLIEKSKINILYKKKKNGGPNSARNFGMKFIKSNFVGFLDADDCWYENKLKKQIEKFKMSNDHLGVVYCEYSLINENGDPIYDIPIMKIDKTIKGYIFKRLLKANMIIGSASGVLIKRKALELTGGFDETLKIGEDWDMWLRLSEKYAFDYVDEELVIIRKHPDSAQSNDEYVFANQLNFYNKWAERLPRKYICPRAWASIIAMHIIRRLPKRDFLQMALNGLNKKAQKRLFWIFGGSMRLYIIAALAYICMANIFAILVSIAVEIKRSMHKIIIVIRYDK